MELSPELLVIISVVCTFILTVAISRIVIPILKSHKMGQKILDIGPRWHKSKEGTPTMGGISFIFAMTVVIAANIALLAFMYGEVPLALTLTFVYALLCAFIGCIDDTAKLRRKQNEGLTPLQKIILQFVIAAAYIAAMVYFGCIDDTVYIPYIGFTLEHGGILYYALLVVLSVGVMNSVNLADGIDGLAATETLVVSALFVTAGLVKYASHASFSGEIAALGAVTAGGMLGFLVYNFHPARVFMGDTGSLFLGGIVMGGALMLKNPLIVIVYAMMYIIESVSDILQVVYFKLTHGKRLFRMAPIHHHFEKCGWGEVKIVVVFSIMTALFCAAAYFGLPAISVLLRV